MNNTRPEKILEGAYALIAELWCHPADVASPGEYDREHAAKVIESLESINRESAHLLSAFLKESAIAEEDYVDLFELDPQCALYLGSHSYDEPMTCAGSAVSDRNEYMIELTGMYKHFGQIPNGKELPDFLPLMTEFLSLTAGSREDPVREKFINEYFLPYLPPMRERLEALQTPYLHLLDALERVMVADSKSEPLPDRRDREVRSNVG